MKRNGYFRVDAIAQIENKYYFLDYDNNGLYKGTVSEELSEYIGYVKTNEYFNKYWMGISYKNEVIFVPTRSSEEIAVYDTVSNDVSYIEIPYMYKNYASTPFKDYYIFGESIYLIPCYYPGILKIDMDTKITAFIDLHTSLEDVGKRLFFSSTIIGDTIYLCPCELDYLVSFNMRSGKIDRVISNLPKNYFCGIVEFEEYIVLVPKKITNPLFLITRDGISKRYINSTNKLSEDIVYTTLIEDKETHRIYLFPENDNQIYELDLALLNIEEIYIENFNQEKKFQFGYRRKMCDGKWMIASNSKDTPMLIYEKGVLRIFGFDRKDDYWLKQILMMMEE